MKDKSSDYKLVSGLFFRLLPYQMLLIVINAVNGIVDGLYASNAIGKGAMSAIGLYGPLNHFLYAASIMLVSGSQLLYGRYLGRKPEAVQSVFSVDLVITAALSALTSALMIIGALTNATRVLVDAEADRMLLNQYIIGQAIGIPGLMLGQQLFGFLSLENQSRRTMAAGIICFVANALMDHIFVVFLNMGTFGLGIASSISVIVFFAVQAQYYFTGKSELRLSFKNCRWGDALEIVRLGYSGALSRFVEMFRCLIVNALVLQYVGSVGLSAFAASNSLLAVIWAVPFGMMAVARMLFSISIGEQDRRSLTDTMHVVLTKGMLVMCGIAALLILSAEPLTQLFYRDPADPVYGMTVMGFRLLPLCMPLAVISLHFACYAQAAEKRALSIVLPIVDGAVSVVVFSFFLIPVMGMNGLYLANILNGVVCLLLIVGFAWFALKRFPRNLEDVMAIPAGFGATEDERMDITVRDMSEVTSVANRVSDFCKQRGIDARRTYLASLALEEMAGNVVLHGFTKDQKKHSLDIRVVHKDDKVILRLRDDCRAFNPSDRVRASASEDGIKNIGIRMIYGLAKNIQYQNLLGLNVLTIKI